jgi:hypothetical protein
VVRDHRINIAVIATPAHAAQDVAIDWWRRA